jgi:hypothetical protein
MRKIYRWLMLLWLPILLAACGGSDDGSKGSNLSPTNTAATTVMVYMVGADLESKYAHATHNIEQMLKATGSKDVNVVLTTGAADKAVPGDLVDDWRTVRRYEIRDGKLKMIADLGRRSMVDPSTLSDFIVWAKQAYPAQRYRLVMWDHGGGQDGFGSDENFPGDIMSVPQIATALDTARESTGIHFDLIGFDACLMATAEVANALAPYADYLAASEEVEPGSGWDYRVILSGLSAEPSMAALPLGKLITDSYIAGQKAGSDAAQAKGALTRADSFITFSITDLSRIGELTDALKSFSTALSDYAQASTDQWVKVAHERALTSSFGPQSSQTIFFDLVDLGAFADRLAAANIIPEQSRSIAAAVRQAVAYRGNGPLAATTSGLSVYFPSLNLGLDRIEPYDELDFPQEYKSMLRAYVNYASNGQSESVISIDTSRSTTTVLDGVVKSAFGLKDASMVVTQPTADPNVVSIVMGKPINVTSHNSGEVLTRMSKGRVMLNGESIYYENLRTSERVVDGKTERVESLGVAAYVNGDFAILVFEAVGDGDLTFVGMWDGVDEDENVVPRTRNDLKPTDTIQLALLDFDLVKQDIVNVRPSGKSFPVGQMELSEGDFSSSMGTFRLVVSDFREFSRMSDAIPARF